MMRSNIQKLKMTRTALLVVIAILLFPPLIGTKATGVKESMSTAGSLWPAITSQTRPWTRWWWHGSAVNPPELTANMEELKRIGFGGLEITPIYDVRGSENLSISFQSADWMRVLEHTLREGRRLDLGIDLANASGWPFGGMWIGDDDACKDLQYRIYTVRGGERLREKVSFIQPPLIRAVGHKVEMMEVRFPLNSNTNMQKLALDQIRFERSLPLQALIAYGRNGERHDLTRLVAADGTLDWMAPAGDWQLYAIFQGWHGKMVERAGTGGEGNVIDHFSESALRNFLKKYDDQSRDFRLDGLRAFFNDSYEVDDAQGESDWTPRFFDEFRSRRGYDLRDHLPALLGPPSKGSDEVEKRERVLADYRETISDLLLDRFTKVWADWAKGHHAIIRNQAHGSPANILDLYEASDIPETEGTDPMRIKMASSAGHVSGKPLISCEATTWLDEHFTYDLADVKQNIDRYLAHGINHIVYHGTPYSPRSEAWPGWMFYASAHFAPTNSWWSELKTINEYVANCQSFLQTAKPDNDLLLYWPIHDGWAESGRTRLRHFGGHTEELTKGLSESLLAKGFLFDYISDRQIGKLTFAGGRIRAAGASYKTILVPSSRYIPLATIEKLHGLAESGATILFEEHLPGDVSGLYDLPQRQARYDSLKQALDFRMEGGVKVSRTKAGRFMTGRPESLLERAGLLPEEAISAGLWMNRVRREDGLSYFISNWSGSKIVKWVTINSTGREALWFNPMNRSVGRARTRAAGKGRSEVFLQLEPGESLILQWYSKASGLPEYNFWSASSAERELTGEWELKFVRGGPTLPAELKSSVLKSWPDISAELQAFSGTARYAIDLPRPATSAPAYLLDLGKVMVTATVHLNGERLATLIGPGYRLVIDSSKLKAKNRLEIEISNLMANRIIDMEKRGLNYKKFYNINFAANRRENLAKDGTFTAIGWQPFESGLIGPVTLTPLQQVDKR